MRGWHNHCTERHPADNIAFRNLDTDLVYEPFDVVYTWVNGSDPRWKRKKDEWSGKAGKLPDELLVNTSNATMFLNTTTGANETAVDPDDTMSSNRYRDSEELRFSLRSLVKNAPWIRHIYIVTDNQIPYWLNLESQRLTVVSHEDIFLNKSHLPVFSSPAIEANLHRIPGLSKKFIYFNDDVFLGAKVLPEDFISLRGAQKLVMSWDVPKCAPGCSDSWIGDGFCDKACNVSSCNFDFPDCINGTNSQSTYTNSRPSSSIAMCAKGCPDTWLADKICDQRCKNEECGWDLGDCGLDLVTLGFPGVAIDRSNARILETSNSAGTEFGYGIGSSYQYGAPESFFDYTTNTAAAEGEDQDAAGDVVQGDRGENAQDEGATNALQAGDTTASEHNSTAAVAHNTTSDSTGSADVPTSGSLRARASPPVHHLQAPALTVEYGTTAVYFDLSFLPCMYSQNATCIPEQTTNFLYESSEHNDESGNLIHSATLLSRHHLLVVLLYHGQDNAPEVNWIVYDVKFTVSVLNALSSETATATFSIRVFPQGHQKIRHPAELVPAGMSLLPLAHAHSCLPDSAYGVTRGNTSIIVPSKEAIFLKSAEILAHPYHTFDDGAILAVEVGVRENAAVLSQQSARLAVAYTITPTRGSAQRIVLLHCSSLLQFHLPDINSQDANGAAVGGFDDFCSKSRCLVCPATLEDVLSVTQHSADRFASYVASKGPQRSPRFLSSALPASTGVVVNAENNTTVVVSNAEEVRFVYHRAHLKVPMPVRYASLTSSQWFHIHMQVISLPINTDGSPAPPPLVNQWHPVSAGVPVLGEQLLCVSAAVRWGRDLPVANITDSANATSAAKVTHSDSTATALPVVADAVATTPPDVEITAITTILPDENPVSSVTDSTTTAAAPAATAAVIPTADTNVAANVDTSTDANADAVSSSEVPARRLTADGGNQFVSSVVLSVRTALVSLHTRIMSASTTLMSLLNRVNIDDTQEISRRRLEDTYAQSLVHVNRIYNKEFGSEGRKVPAHVPHMMDREYLQEMQTKWPEQWIATSSHRFRSASDMQYSFSYYYYLANRQKVHPPDLHKYMSAVLDTDKDGYVNENEFRSLAAVAKGSNAAPSVEYIERLYECVVNSSTYQRHHTEEVQHSVPLGKIHRSFSIRLHPNIAQVLNCTEISEGLQKNVNWGAIQPSHVFESDKEHVAFEMIGDNYTISVNQLDSVRARQSKFVCINDNMVNPTPELEKALRSFYEAFFPEPCVFELPPGQRNPTLYLDEYKALKAHEHAGHLVVNFVRNVQVSMWRWLHGTVKSVLLPLAHSTVDALSNTPQPSAHAGQAEHYVNGLRADLHRHPAYSHHAHTEDTAAALSRNVLLFSVVGVIGFALLRILSRRHDSWSNQFV